VRVLIGGIVHESSTFVLQVMDPTGPADFEVHAGAELLTAFGGTNTIVGGYLAACRRHGAEPVPALHARAEPGPAVDPAAYLDLERRLLARAGDAGPADVILLDLHGAGSLTSGESLDLAVVRRVRDLAGPATVIGATLDLHANLPAELVELTDVLVGFQEYPHTDMAVRAELTADIAIGLARGTLRPVHRKLDLPMILPPTTTLAGPAARARDLARQQEREPGVLACTVLHGFPYVDNAHASTSVLTVTDGSAALADEVNRRLGSWLWENRAEFEVTPLSPRQAVATALAGGGGPAVIGDGTDNPGSGAPGDSTYLLRELLASGARTCLATLHDPAAAMAAAQAGPGARLDIELGGRHDWASGPPVPVRAIVRAVTDGRVVQQNMRRGKVLDFGLSARLEVGQSDVIVCSQRRQVFDPEILLLHGIVPERYDLIGVKSVNHFRAGFASLATALLVADAPGPLTRDIVTLPRSGPTARLWPMNEAARGPLTELLTRPLTEPLTEPAQPRP
jgi:microcystin degradation protein MlrC